MTLYAPPAAWGLLGAAAEALDHALPGTHALRVPGAAAAATGAMARDGGRIALVLGAPHWADAELAALAQARGDAHALLLAARRFGDDAPALLRGSFAVAVLDGERDEVLLATDRFGRIPWYYAPLGAGFGFATAPGLLRRHPQAAGDIDPQAVFDYAYAHVVPAPHVIFQGQRKLLAAQRLIRRQGRERLAVYWQPTFGGTRAAVRETERAQELLARIRKSVEGCAGASTGAFLSGGLDSSTVAGALAGALAGAVAGTPPGGARTYTIGFEAAAYDERGYARISARHFGTLARERVLQPVDVIDALPALVTQCPEPFGNSSLLATYACAQLAAADGCTHLLAGDGGDELFGGNARYARQRLFAPYERLPAPARRALEGLAPHLPAPLGKLRSYIDQARIPLPDRLQAQNFVHTLGAQALFTPELLAAVDTAEPLALQRSHYHRVQGAPLDRMLYFDWQWTLADNDLQKVGIACAAAGVRVDFPLLDEDIVELACALPPRMKVRGRQLRWFYRRAMRGFLPDEVLAKRKHGFGLPFGVWLREDRRLQSLAYDNLLALRARKLLRADFIERAIELHRTGHADYYGELVWVLMMLELWLSAHERNVPSSKGASESAPVSCPKA